MGEQCTAEWLPDDEIVRPDSNISDVANKLRNAAKWYFDRARVIAHDGNPNHSLLRAALENAENYKRECAPDAKDALQSVGISREDFLRIAESGFSFAVLGWLEIAQLHAAQVDENTNVMRKDVIRKQVMNDLRLLWNNVIFLSRLLSLPDEEITVIKWNEKILARSTPFGKSELNRRHFKRIRALLGTPEVGEAIGEFARDAVGRIRTRRTVLAPIA